MMKLSHSPYILAAILGCACVDVNVFRSNNEVSVISENGKFEIGPDRVEIQPSAEQIELTNIKKLKATQADNPAIYELGDLSPNRVHRISNLESGIIQSDDDAVRFESDLERGQIFFENLGLVESLVEGNALDFERMKSADENKPSITIENRATGRLISADGDAVRPGQFGHVNNSGLIQSNGPDEAKTDGIDFQGHSGSVRNLAGGVISGQRHGITTDVHIDVHNEADGHIIGRNGSGIGSDGSGRVVNHGRITGDYKGFGNGDGDGIDIDEEANIENYGIIEALAVGGVDKDGKANSSEGIAMTGGGSFRNHNGAKLTGASMGLAVITPVGRNSFIENSGSVYGKFVGILSHGAGEITIVNSGSISAGGDTLLTTPVALRLLGLKTTLIIREGSEIAGQIISGDVGEVHLVLEDGSIFDQDVDFTSLTVNGNAELIGENTFSDITVSEGSTLKLGRREAAGGLLGNIVNNGTIIIERADGYELDDRIKGSGRVIRGDE